MAENGALSFSEKKTEAKLGRPWRLFVKKGLAANVTTPDTEAVAGTTAKDLVPGTIEWIYGALTHTPGDIKAELIES